MTLKERMEAVWRDDKIACPNNLTRWSEKQIGYSSFMKFGLWFTKGKLLRPKNKKIKGKGYTWLSKNYGLMARFHAKEKVTS